MGRLQLRSTLAVGLALLLGIGSEQVIAQRVRLNGAVGGPFYFADGTAALPGLTFDAQRTLGFYRAASGQLGVTVGGVNVGTFTSTGFTLGASTKFTFPNATTLTDTALGTLAMVSSAATNGIQIPNGSNAEYGGCVWASNFLNCGVVTNGGIDRPVRFIAGLGQSVVLSPGGADAWILSSTGATKISGLVTTARGVGAIVAQNRVAAATNTGSASVATFTVGAADGTFQVGCNVLVTTSTTHSFSCDVTYTDESNAARTLVLPVAQLAGTFVTTGLITNVTGVGPYESPMMTIRAKAATAITIRTSAGGTFTTVVYNIDGTIVQVS